MTFVLIGWVLFLLILLDLAVLDMRRTAEWRKLSKMEPIERLEYLAKKYGKDGLDYYEELKAE